MAPANLEMTTAPAIITTIKNTKIEKYTKLLVAIVLSKHWQDFTTITSFFCGADER